MVFYINLDVIQNVSVKYLIDQAIAPVTRFLRYSSRSSRHLPQLNVFVPCYSETSYPFPSVRCVFCMQFQKNFRSETAGIQPMARNLVRRCRAVTPPPPVDPIPSPSNHITLFICRLYLILAFRMSQVDISSHSNKNRTILQPWHQRFKVCIDSAFLVSETTCL